MHDLNAVFINCSLKKSPETSHTEGLMSIPMQIMKDQGINVELIRAIDYDIPSGVYPDMTEHGWDKDEWFTKIKDKVLNCDILVIGTPIWLGDKSSVCTKVIERLYGHSSETNEKGQYRFYGKVGGCIITGNEDGVKHCSMNILYSLQHVGFTIPPQADAGWIGEVGPGASYLDEGSGGSENDFTNRNATFMAWNLIHFAKMLKSSGIPSQGNVPKEWKEGKRFGWKPPKKF
jgi:multimeric flavodoxin WrbA